MILAGSTDRRTRAVFSLTLCLTCPFLARIPVWKGAIVSMASLPLLLISFPDTGTGNVMLLFLSLSLL